MSDTSVSPSVRGGSENGATTRITVGAPRTISRRRTLPSGRALAGGFLIALSVLGIFLAWSTAAAGPTTRYLVAARDLPIGTRVTASDLRAVPMELPASLASTSAFQAASEVDGVTVINPIRAGELIQASSLVAGGGAGLEISFAVERDRAVGGRLKAGEFVDLLATFGTGPEAYTTTIARGARILDITSSRDALGSSGPLTVTIAVADAQRARAVAHAVDAAKLTLVRSSAAAGRSDEPGSDSIYRGPGAPED